MVCREQTAPKWSYGQVAADNEGMEGAGWEAPGAAPPSMAWRSSSAPRPPAASGISESSRALLEST